MADISVLAPKKPYWSIPTIVVGQFHVNSQEVVRSPTPIFLKFYSNFKKITAMIIPCDEHLQIWMFVKKSYDYKAF